MVFAMVLSVDAVFAVRSRTVCAFLLVSVMQGSALSDTETASLTAVSMCLRSLYTAPASSAQSGFFFSDKTFMYVPSVAVFGGAQSAKLLRHLITL